MSNTSWKDALSVPVRERNGMILLLGLILLLNALRYFIRPQHSIEKLQINYTMDNTLTPTAKSMDTAVSIPLPQRKLFKFDPNQLHDEGWQLLGLKQKQLRIIRNYLNKGGQFRHKEDLLKIYGIDTLWFQCVSPYIQLPNIFSVANMQSTPPVPKEYALDKSDLHETIELNAADSSDLVLLPGIGSFHARNILKYRAALGGFVSLNQLDEVWRFPPGAVQRILTLVDVDESKVQKLQINRLEAAELAKHPYLTASEATAIVNYRKKHGNYKQLSDLAKLRALRPETPNRLSPYLSFEP